MRDVVKSPARVFFLEELRTACFQGLSIGSLRGLRTASLQGLRTVSLRGLRTVSLQGLHTVSLQGLRTASLQGLRTVSRRGLILPAGGTSYCQLQGTYGAGRGPRAGICLRSSNLWDSLHRSQECVCYECKHPAREWGHSAGIRSLYCPVGKH